MALENLLWVQFWVLLAGTIFAWYQWLKVFKKSKTCAPCNIAAHPDPNCHACLNPEKPFRSKCFYGAVFFTIAFLVNLWTLYELSLMMTVGA